MRHLWMLLMLLSTPVWAGTPLGLEVTHMAWFAAHATEGIQLGGTDTNRTHEFIMPLGVRWAIHKTDAGSLTEYFKPFCRIQASGVWGAWTEVVNSFGTLGVRYVQDTGITQGQATVIRLPTGGFTGVAGKILENPIDTTAPYDASQRLTLVQGQHTELEVRLEFGTPLVGGEQVECRPQRENGVTFDTYMSLNHLVLAPDYSPSWVLILTSGSPAINAVACVPEVPMDLRGISRPQGMTCDIGAYESESATIIARRQGGGGAGGIQR